MKNTIIKWLGIDKIKFDLAEDRIDINNLKFKIADLYQTSKKTRKTVTKIKNKK